MTGFGSIQVGRLLLREAQSAVSEKTDDDGNATLSISGQESSAGRSRAELAAVQDDIRGLAGALVPVTFTDKAGRNGYYTVSGPSAELMDWQGEVITLGWSMTLQRMGSDSEVDLESQLSGPLTRTNLYTLVGERWQAPPIGHSAFWSSSTTPSVMTRTGADGAQTVYRGVPVGVNTRWACPVESYGVGRVRILDNLLLERSGTDFPLEPAGFELSNGLVRVRWDAAGLKVASHDGTSYVSRTFVVNVGGEFLPLPSAVTVVRNDFEIGCVRLLWSRLTAGRTTVDVTVRRGSRACEGYISTGVAGTMSIGLEIPEASTASPGYITATANDASGDRFVLGSVGTFTASTGTASISKSSTATMDFFAAAVIGGGSAVTGDTADVLYSQMLGASGESTRTVRR